ncbi:MAG TPA: radical SAM protein [Methanoregulaceae archaeon]|nr:radical SAM protein [Methanoregulaceae archaeon]HQJ87222.1 radical SAM protein [Methanoregulaceae archaeon]
MKVAEVFYSLQGEGKNQGRPTVFLRLAGCNLACRWCDTPSARDGGVEWRTAEVVDAVRAVAGSCRLVCVTGGEPLLQQEALVPVLEALSREGFSCEIETNGTIPFGPSRAHAGITMDVKCPSSGEESDLSLLSALGPEDAVKFVVADTTDLAYAGRVLAEHPTRAEVFVSPVHGVELSPLVEYILEQHLPVRFSLQLHKLIGVR